MSSPCLSIRSCAALAMLLAAGNAAAAQTTNSAASTISTNRVEQLRALTLEDLLHREISSVSKRPEDWFKAPAAVFVITDEDIRRSGARTFPEILRMAPGIQVAQVDSSKWAVGSRGQNDLFSDKLLVMMDGRTLYSPVNSGVFWDIQDYLLEDIERIEVVRGPGGTLWGANAVNGVINIITKSARDTVGTYATGGGGTDPLGFGGARYGGQLSENGFYRAYVNYSAYGHHPKGRDDWQVGSAGFRYDLDPESNHLTIQGEYRENSTDMTLFVPFTTTPFLRPRREQLTKSSGNILARWTHQFSNDSDVQVQTYYDRFEEHRLSDQLQETFDIDAQHHLLWGERQNIVYGVGYRYTPDRLEANTIFQYAPEKSYAQVFSAFLQDEITLVKDRLRLTLGSKVEHNDFTGWEHQPNGRIAWTVASNHVVWGAVSRAVQVPNRNFNDLTISQLFNQPPIVGGLPALTGFHGNRDLDAQNLLSYELGYRVEVNRRASLDLAAFYSDYDDLLVGSVGTPQFVGTHFQVPVTVVNGGHGEAWGFEATANWQVTDWWRLAPTYSFLRVHLDDNVALAAEDGDPQNQVSLRSMMNLPHDVTFDIWGRFVDQLEAFSIDSYFDLDVRLAWRPNKRWELAAVGQNLIESRRVEFKESSAFRSAVTPVARGCYFQVSFWF
jgi:iron complex outermembrane recepter protein